MQRLEGDGLAFLHVGGTIIQKELSAGATLHVDTGCLVAFAPTVDYDIQFVGGFKNALFGGEGLFLAKMTGPGMIYLQSLPFSRLADRIYAGARFRQIGEQTGIAGFGGELLGGISVGERLTHGSVVVIHWGPQGPLSGSGYRLRLWGRNSCIAAGQSWPAGVLAGAGQRISAW